VIILSFEQVVNRSDTSARHHRELAPSVVLGRQLEKESDGKSTELYP